MLAPPRELVKLAQDRAAAHFALLDGVAGSGKTHLTRALAAAACEGRLLELDLGSPECHPRLAVRALSAALRAWNAESCVVSVFNASAPGMDDDATGGPARETAAAFALIERWRASGRGVLIFERGCLPLRVDYAFSLTLPCPIVDKRALLTKLFASDDVETTEDAITAAVRLLGGGTAADAAALVLRARRAAVSRSIARSPERSPGAASLSRVVVGAADVAAAATGNRLPDGVEFPPEVPLRASLHAPRDQIIAEWTARTSLAVCVRGPAGQGKSHFARAVAGSSRSALLEASVAQVAAKYVGESEQNVHSLFASAALVSPCVLVLDGSDALLGSGATSRVVGQIEFELRDCVRRGAHVLLLLVGGGLAGIPCLEIAAPSAEEKEAIALSAVPTALRSDSELVNRIKTESIWAESSAEVMGLVREECLRVVSAAVAEKTVRQID